MNAVLGRIHNSLIMRARMAGKRRKKSEKDDPILHRILLLQQAFDQGNRAAFARRVKLSPQQLWNYEHTPQPVTLASLVKIKRHTAVSWEWLLEDDETTLRGDILAKLRAVNDAPTPPPPSAPRGRKSRARA